MAYIHPEATDTRARMIASYRKALEGLVEDATQRPGDVVGDGELSMSLGDWDGVPVVTRKRLDEAVDAVFGLPVPAPDERRAEVSTPATVWVSAVCPRCAIPQVILMTVHPELLVDDDGSELRVKAKAKGVSHTCGQLPLEERPAGDPDGLVQTEVMASIERLAQRVWNLLSEALEEGVDVPALDVIRSWDRAVIDQVDRWATASLGHDPSAAPPLPRVLGGEADPELEAAPAAEDAPADPAIAALEELLRPGETLDAALARLEADPDHLDIMGSDAGQRLLSEINRGRGHAVLVPFPWEPDVREDDDPAGDQDIPEASDDDDSDLLPA